MGMHVAGQDSQSRRGPRRPRRAWQLPPSPPPPADWPPLSAPLPPSRHPSSLHPHDHLIAVAAAVPSLPDTICTSAARSIPVLAAPRWQSRSRLRMLMHCMIWLQKAWQPAAGVTSYCCTPQIHWPGITGFVLTLVPGESITCSDELLGFGRPGLPDAVPLPCA